MTTYRDAVRRLQIIYNECAPQAKSNKVADKDLDEFTRIRKQIHVDVKQTRLMLKEREELLAVKPGSKEAAEASHRIRSRLKTLREDFNRLQTAFKQDEKKIKDTEIVRGRAEIIQLVMKHIEECEQLEKKRFNDKVSSDRSALLSGAANIKIEMTNFKEKPTGVSSATDSELPDIDPEVGEGLQQIQETNREIDQDLDQIRANVGILKEIAINMDQEITKQNQMLDTIDKKVDKAQEHLDNVNVKMKKAIEGVAKGDKFIVYCVLISMLLCLAAFIASEFM